MSLASSWRWRTSLAAAGTSLAFTSLSAACLVWSADAPIALFLPVLSLVGVAAVGVVVLAAAGSIPALVTFLAAIVFLTDGNFRVKPGGDAGLDWQSLLKFAVWMAAGLVGLPRMPPLGRVVRNWGGAMWLCYTGFAALSAFYAPSPVFSLGYALSLLCLYVFALAVAERLPEATILWTFTATLAVFLLAGWVVFYADPALGRFEDLTSNGLESRMRGIAGQANNLGTVCAVYLGAAFILGWNRHCSWATALVLAAPGIVTLLATDSRTGLIAVAVGVAVVLLTRASWLAMAGAAAVTLVLAIALSLPIHLGDLGAAISRSGDPNEAYTLTGRTQIWSFAWQRILESPWVGWGYNSSKVILAQHLGFDNGLLVDQAHNLLLQNLLSVGFIGTLPLLGLFLKLVADIVRGTPDALSVLFMVIVFVTGISDPAALGTTPTLLTFVFMLASLWPWTPTHPAAWMPRRVRGPAPTRGLLRAVPRGAR